jgi:hypothetical protein
MDATIEQLILDELKELRDDLRDFRGEVAGWKAESGERLATLETQVKDVVGNGQPGRMTIAEEAIGALQRWRYWVLGGAAGVSGVVSVVAWVIVRVMR